MSGVLQPRPDGIGEDDARPRGLRRHGGVFVTLALAGLTAVAASGALGRGITRHARANGVSLVVRTSAVVRCGEIWETRASVTSDRDLDELTLEIGADLWRDVTVNALTPTAREERSRDGTFAFTFARLPAGATFVWQADLQANPDAIGARTGFLRVLDGDEPLVELPLEQRVLP